MTYLLDINVLVALFNPAHIHHHPAHQWFAATGKHSWATCPLTESGFVRVISNPGYTSVSATPAEAALRLRVFCSDPAHTFWPGTLSILDPTRFDLTKLQGHRQITDACLAALAQHHAGKLATLDGSIPIAAVVGASASVIELIPTN